MNELDREEGQLDNILSSMANQLQVSRTDPVQAAYAYMHYADLRAHAPHAYDHILVVVRSPHASNVYVHSPNELGVSRIIPMVQFY